MPASHGPQATPATPSSIEPTGGSPTAPPLPASGTWTRLEASGEAPAAREDHTWTVDESGQTAYLFGGRSGGTVYDDLWAYDFASDAWREIQPSGARPPGRFGHEAAWTPLKGGLVVSLGQAGSRFFDDIWHFDPATATWRELPAAGAAPVARYGSCSGTGPDGRFWISHGFTSEGSRFSDTRAYDLESEEWANEPPAADVPVERCLHVCWWTVEGTLTLFGGQTTGAAALGDLWSLVPGEPAPGIEWFRLAEPDAGPRHLPAIARRGLVTYVFGGRDVDREPLGDTWLVPDSEAGRFAQLSTPTGPPPRSGAALVHDPGRDRMLLFGGIGDAALDDLWVLAFD